MKTVQFGRAQEFVNSATRTSVAASGTQVLELHRSDSYADQLWYRLGTLRDTIVDWGPLGQFGGPFQDDDHDRGDDPACAMNSGGNLVAVHHKRSGDLFLTTGRLVKGLAYWDLPLKFDTGTHPRVAMNDARTVVEVHQYNSSRQELYCRVGVLESTGHVVGWGAPASLGAGTNPSVTIDAYGNVVVMFEPPSGGVLLYRVGHADSVKKLLTWTGEAQLWKAGRQPAVALTGDHNVIAVHQQADGDGLFAASGPLAGAAIQWNSPDAGALFDDGILPALAWSGSVAVQTHRSQGAETLWYSTSRFIDRAKWMETNLGTLGDKPLNQLTFPGSHNAAMYRPEDRQDLGNRDQNLTVGEQLGQGVRWFDLRPAWSDGEIHFHHGATIGVTLAEVLDQVRSFMLLNRELVMLRFSHFQDIDDNAYNVMVAQIFESLGPWMFRQLPNGKSRLVEVTLSEFLDSHHGAALVLIENGDYPKTAQAGLWIYREAIADDVAEADLIGFNNFVGSDDFEQMSGDCITQFAKYQGKTTNPKVPCDLFLLGWCETGHDNGFDRSMEADAKLGLGRSQIVTPNQFGKVVNMIDLDFSQSARPVDVCLSLLGIDK